MKTTATLIALFFSLCTYAQTDWKQDLTEPAVEVIDGQYVAEDFMIIKSNGKTIQMHFLATMPSDSFIHRDNMVMISTMLLSELMQELGNDFEVEHLDSLIGDADMEIKFTFQDAGLQVSATYGGEVKRETLTWEQYYAEH